MTDDTPNIIHSGKSQSFIVDGYRFDIQIYRGEDEAEWLLEVVDSEGSSHVWDDRFASDKDARDAALQALEKEGALGFMRGEDRANVVPFRPR
ncbi:hypothetical protein GIY56_06080 [Paracoccus sp. YIM 132242]|uniref:Uncharacterized protein n=1 Tax=Paracoccus lichenicola TaxID=2665644 RepID=A0A6L6HRE0_9RHOB|nr:hypothetical protein [Paracoccus lichenicola]MTD99847.1 hypothetical protein [Paracoccus lichenicola]